MFTDAPHKEIRWLRPNFRHCYIVRDDDPVWTCLHPGRNYLDVSYFLKSEFPTIESFVMDDNASIVKCELNGDKSNYSHGFSIVSCVGACKYFLGLQKPLIFTPYQLYRCLVKHAL